MREPFSVSESFVYRKSLRIENGYHKFKSTIFSLTMPKIFIGEAFSVSESFVYRESLCKKSGCHEIQSNIFCLTVPKFFIPEPFSVSESLGYRESLCIKRRYYDFLWIFFVSQFRMFSCGNTSVYHNNSGIEKNYT